MEEAKGLRLDLIDFFHISCPRLTPAVKLRLFLNLSKLNKKWHILTIFPEAASVKKKKKERKETCQQNKQGLFLDVTGAVVRGV